MNILCIGNSFSQDATRYLHSIARSDGTELNVTNLFIGGCTLETHYNNMNADRRAYALEYNGHQTGFFVSLNEALANRPWDVITLQQASQLSFRKGSYSPYIFALIEYIREKVPSAKIYIHQTWAYEDGSDMLHRFAKLNTSSEMFCALKNTYEEIAKEISADGIIRSGELFWYLLHNGVKKIHRDTFHATLGLGRYALGMLWYNTLCGKDVSGNGFCDFDEPVSPEHIALIKKYLANQ